jgi:YHS domain-containing protein
MRGRRAALISLPLFVGALFAVLLTKSRSKQGVSSYIVLEETEGCKHATVDCEDLSRPVLKGTDVVSYFYANMNPPVVGSPEFSTRYKDNLYFFSTEQTLKEFLTQPERYVPQFGSFCAWGIAEESGVSTCTGVRCVVSQVAMQWSASCLGPYANPNEYAVFEDKLYVFMCPSARALWLQDPSTHAADGAVEWASLFDGQESTPMNTKCMFSGYCEPLNLD